MTRFYGVPLRNSLGLGLGGIISMGGAYDPDFVYDNLELEDGADILLEDGGLILLEGLMPTLWLDFQYSTSLDSRITFSRASTATYFNNLGVLTTAASGAPRFDYDPSTLQPRGLLIEEQRTNLLLQSQDFATTWTQTNSSITANTIVAPDGTLTGDKLVEDTAASTHEVRSANISLASGTAYTRSFYAKAGERGGAYVNFAGIGGASFNLLTGSVNFQSSASATLSAVTATITSVGNGWYRCVAVVSALSNVSYGVRIGACSSTYAGVAESYTGDGTSGIYIWGAQLEAGAFATSYIPTTTTALTRNADVASMTGTNFSSWFNASEGTFVAQYFPNAVAPATTGQVVFNTNDGTSLNAIQLSKRANVDASTRYTTDAGGSGQTFSNLGVFTATQTTTAVAYKENDFAGIKSGGSLVTDTLGTVPTLNRMVIGADRLGAGSINGYIQRIAYYPTRLPNATLQVLTT